MGLGEARRQPGLTEVPGVDKSFPVPFDAIDCYIECRDQYQLTVAVNALILCGHRHNYAVQGDGARVWTSYGGGECIQRAFDHARGGA